MELMHRSLCTRIRRTTSYRRKQLLIVAYVLNLMGKEKWFSLKFHFSSFPYDWKKSLTIDSVIFLPIRTCFKKCPTTLALHAVTQASIKDLTGLLLMTGTCCLFRHFPLDSVSCTLLYTEMEIFHDFYWENSARYKPYKKAASFYHKQEPCQDLKDLHQDRCGCCSCREYQRHHRQLNHCFPFPKNMLNSHHTVAQASRLSRDQGTSPRSPRGGAGGEKFWSSKHSFGDISLTIPHSFIQKLFLKPFLESSTGLQAVLVKWLNNQGITPPLLITSWSRPFLESGANIFATRCRG